MKLEMTRVGILAGNLALFATAAFALILFLLDQALYRVGFDRIGHGPGGAAAAPRLGTG